MHACVHLALPRTTSPLPLQVLLAGDDLDVFKGVELKLRHVALPGSKIQPTHFLFPVSV